MKIQPASFAFTLLVAGLAALPPLSTDMMLSALPVIGTALRASPITAGYAVSFFFAGFSLAQLFFGPCSDRFGRRPVGLAGCALFALAGFGCTFAGSIGALLAWRVAQGIGAGAGAVLAFAIVRDNFSGPEARVRFAYVNACMSFAPMLAPTLGSLIYIVWGWRAIFAVLAVAGVLLVAALGTVFEESLPRERRVSLAPAMLARNYWRVLSHRSALTHSLLAALTFGSMMAYVTGSPFIFISILGLTRSQFGVMFFATASGIMLGSSLSGWLGHRFHVAGSTLLLAGLLIALAATAALCTLGALHLYTPAHAIPLLMLATFATGLTAPTIAHGVLSPMGDLAGTAAAVLGSIRMLGGAASAAIVAGGAASTPFAMSTVMCGFSLAALLAYAALSSRGRS